MAQSMKVSSEQIRRLQNTIRIQHLASFKHQQFKLEKIDCRVNQRHLIKKHSWCQILMFLRRDWICEDRHYDVDISAVGRSSECRDRFSVSIVDERSSRHRDRFLVDIVDGRSSECEDRFSVSIVDERSSECEDRFSVSIVGERSSECRDRFLVSIVDERSSRCRDRHLEVSIVVSIKSDDDDCSIVVINIIFMYISDIDDCKTRDILIVFRQLYCFHQSHLFHMTENLLNSL